MRSQTKTQTNRSRKCAALFGVSMQASAEVIELIAQLIHAKARESFLEFRRQIRPQLLLGWWVVKVAQLLQQFYDDFAAGKRPKLALLAPPQHGKSVAATDFVAWVAGRAPEKKTIFASFSEELGVRTNTDLQRIMSSDVYKMIFPHTRIGLNGWQCNSSIIEFAGNQGSFQNTTINGQVNGKQLHLGVIDDPVKGRREASSRLMRDATWKWFTDDYYNRFAKDGALLVIMTRWHVDDLLGRLIEHYPELKVLRYPAIAEQDEPHRRAGEALFPEFKPLDFLHDRRKLLTEASWQSLFQQSPIIDGGGLFPTDKIRVLPIFERHNIKCSVRAWDKGATEAGGDYTAGVLMHRMKDGTYVIEDVVRGQWSALAREEKIEATAAADRQAIVGSYEIGIEQEPGSGGKESFEATVRRLAGYNVFADKVTGSKQLRAEPFAAQVQAGNVSLLAGRYVQAFLDELEVFPNGSHDDQVDAAAMAFARLAKSSTYNLEALAS